MNKKVWNKPQLIVLISSSSAEFVLAGCKRYGGNAPAEANNMCQHANHCTNPCSMPSGEYGGSRYR
jgi:hypothetical protein